MVSQHHPLHRLGFNHCFVWGSQYLSFGYSRYQPMYRLVSQHQPLDRLISRHQSLCRLGFTISTIVSFGFTTSTIASFGFHYINHCIVWFHSINHCIAWVLQYQPLYYSLHSWAIHGIHCSSGNTFLLVQSNITLNLNIMTFCTLVLNQNTLYISVQSNTRFFGG